MGKYFAKANVSELDHTIAALRKGFKIMIEFPEFRSSIQLTKTINDVVTNHGQQHGPWTDQIYRSSISIVANIAEAQGRATDAQTLQYYRIARGSAFETLALLLVAPLDLDPSLKTSANQVIRQIDETMTTLAQKKKEREMCGY